MYNDLMMMSLIVELHFSAVMCH